MKEAVAESGVVDTKDPLNSLLNKILTGQKASFEKFLLKLVAIHCQFLFS